MKYEVWMDFINYIDEVSHSEKIAEFCSKPWAEEFYKMAVANEKDGSIRYRIAKSR